MAALRGPVSQGVCTGSGRGATTLGRCRDAEAGALIRIRTGDLVLTKNALCRLSYEGSPRHHVARTKP